jgi:hypothetical protein
MEQLGTPVQSIALILDFWARRRVQGLPASNEAARSGGIRNQGPHMFYNGKPAGESFTNGMDGISRLY